MSKTWFITGASRGFGHSWTEAALRRGDKVAATARDIDTLKDLAVKFGDAILPIALDVTDHAAIIAAVGQVIRVGIAVPSTEVAQGDMQTNPVSDGDNVAHVAQWHAPFVDHVWPHGLRVIV